MLVFASARGSWLLTLGVLGLACTGVREDPSPGEPTPIVFIGSQASGGGSTVGGGDTGGGNTGGEATGFLFEDCSCAAVAESLSVPACNTCAELANMSTSPCGDQRQSCIDDQAGCGLALNLLGGNDCGGDPECAAGKIPGILDDDSAALLFGYFACLCGQCATCASASGAGGGAGEGGAAPSDGSCIVAPG